jgi:septal ring factor EnvC (AmiA/AmiB activator)
MTADRSDFSRGEEQGPTSRPRNNGVLLAETLRNGDARDAAPPGKGEEKISVFWRVFGGTILSITALVVITVYQQFSGALAELRSDMIRSNEARAELLKKEEFNNRLTSVWNSMKDLQTGQAAVTSVRERASLLEQQLKTAEDERKELSRELQKLRERVAALEGRQAHAAHERAAPAAQ